MADVRRVWDICKNVEMGVTPRGELQAAIRRLRDGERVAPAVPA
jgi:hypothetical protein